MFWGLILKANKKYSQKVAKAFHVSQAALDTTSGADEVIQVMLTSENSNYVLCTLRKNKTEQVALDLNFAEGDEIAFTSQGNGSVHLTGYLIPDNDGYFDGLGDEESELSDLETTTPIKNEKPKKKLNNLKEIEEESESDELEMEDGTSDDEDGGEEEEASDSEDEIEEPKPKQKKLEVVKQNGVEKKNKKNKQNKNKLEKLEQQNEVQSNKKIVEKILQGGLKIEDIRVGNGAEAKPGKKVQVFYEGRLKSNNKIFDSSKQGSGFKFGLGRGEVIRGWDVGVAGMKVGGKRRIICPPNMAYGNKGSPPVIPPNSTLVFEVELKGVH